MTKLFKYAHAISALAIGVLTGSLALAQSVTQDRSVATITACANVVGNVDLIVMKNMDFEISDLSPADLTVDPQRDSLAGQMKIVGSPNSLARVTYERESVLRHEGSESQLCFAYNLSGGPSDVQSKSTILAKNNQIRLSDQGAYYLWVGGGLSGMENIVPGNYVTELTIELEYIL
jgi:hypothetical protein